MGGGLVFDPEHLLVPNAPIPISEAKLTHARVYVESFLRHSISAQPVGSSAFFHCTAASAGFDPMRESGLMDAAARKSPFAAGMRWMASTLAPPEEWP